LDYLILAGIAEPDNLHPNLSKIFAYTWQLKKDGKSEGTIIRTTRALKRLSQLCNLDDPEQVKTILATSDNKNSTKELLTQILTGYYKHTGILWTPPTYKREQTQYFIPTEQELDSLISSARKRNATLLQILKETGARIGEILKLKWSDIDAERKILYINHAEKNSNNRILPISPKLIDMLNNLPRTNDKVFPATFNSIRNSFQGLRNRTALKLGNPRLKQIHLHTFRHWKGTTEYHKTKDIIHVKTILGHKKIESTMIYINLENALFQTDTDEYTCKTAKTIQEATDLIEHGFQYITDMDGIKLFRKHK